jgi:hypothetical protein
MTEQHLDLFQFAAHRAAQLRSRASKIVWRDILRRVLRHARAVAKRQGITLRVQLGAKEK